MMLNDLPLLILLENISELIWQALEAAKTVLDMTSNKRTDAQFLERMMLEIEGQTLTRTSQSHVATNDHKYTNQTCSADSDINCAHDSTDSEVVLVKTQETDRLVELLGKILRQIVQSGGGSEIWGLYARWHKLKGDLTMCSEALLKQVRSYQAGSFSETEEFRDLQACLDEVQMKLQASSAPSA
ncbi:protein prenylyltransferase superfamily protein [Actinidia rufa]|uniref:Protein prenylyltransferase superfamily protein n=1 Tax=Actinidia rufa TaxID=165716 RepID=A0A7J0DYL3_9ERIC|nr:protein prenylyltransferase superfamily protein [Actinidia rufa]